MKTIKLFIYTLIIGLIAVSCSKDDYAIGGDLHNANLNLSAYDFLKSKPLFDTVALLIDKAGMKEEVNQTGTFFAPTDYAVMNYINKRNGEVRETDENLRYTVDTLIKYDLQSFKDSVRMYLIPEVLNRDGLTSEGKVYSTRLANKVKLSLEDSNDYTDNVSTKPKYVYYTYIVADLDDPNDNSIPDEVRDQKVHIQTSGLLSTNGVVHVLNNSHILFFRK